MTSTAHPRQRRIDLAIGAIAIAIGLRLLGLVVRFLTHGIAPALFTHYEHFPALAGAPKRTNDDEERPGDPVNLAIVGTEADVATAFEAAGWLRASKVERSADQKLAESILLRRPDPDAPVSPLYLFGRPQDFAYERERGRTAGKRDHVRFWRTDFRHPRDDRPVWLCATTLDTRSGFILRRMMPTHHIGSDIDEERDTVVQSLVDARRVARLSNVTGLGIRVASRNADGDRFDTDGEMAVLVLAPNWTTAPSPIIDPDPWRVAVKNRIWYALHRERGIPMRDRTE